MRFIAFGLIFESEIPVLDLSCGDGDPQVTVRLDRVEKPTCGIGPQRAFVTGPGEFRAFFRGVGTFLVRQGREILVEPEADAEEALVQLYLLGPVFAILLHQRGLLVLHASAVSIDGSVVGFAGEKGWGKSTTAAALNAKGHPLVADDILAIVPGAGGKPMVQPGIPCFKLWPDAAAAAFSDDPGTLARVHSQIDKRVRYARTACGPEPLPLRCVYVLDGGTHLKSVPLVPTAALMALVRHTYLSRIMKYLDGRDENFRQCAQLVSQVSIRALKRPKNLDALTNIVELVAAEASSDRRTSDNASLISFRMEYRCRPDEKHTGKASRPVKPRIPKRVFGRSQTQPATK
jgi:hypothetical protein